MEWRLSASRLSRRSVLGATAALAAGPALAEECRLGPAPHEKGARVLWIWISRSSTPPTIS